ncbi:hypothetical protein [Streptomyces cinereoruber]|uniref:hypothetical protein n=1 Tax=Streptomyces cinereoruber TaxID=67260 RepID=UPI00365CF58E
MQEETLQDRRITRPGIAQRLLQKGAGRSGPVHGARDHHPVRRAHRTPRAASGIGTAEGAASVAWT